MKKQNFIILGVFLLLIVLFYLISCDETEEVSIIEDEIEEESKYISVSLYGEVLRTGTFNVPKDWTILKLFEYVGLKEEADISSFTLYEILEDGSTYYVPKIAYNQFEDTEKVNINTASINELIKLNGIGEVTAYNIISYRQKSRFNCIDEIKNVSGIGTATYEKIKDFITV